MPADGDVVQAFVSNVSAKGCFLRLSSKISAIVLLKDLSDEYIREPSAVFPCGKLVTGRVLSVNHEENRAKMTLKVSAIVKANASRKEIAALKKRLDNASSNSVVVGTVHRVTEFGVFVKINNTALIGLARRPMAVSSSESRDLRDIYNVGDVVRAKILDISIESEKISLGLKPSLFADDADDAIINGEDLLADDDDGGVDAVDGGYDDDGEVLLEVDDDDDDDDDIEELIKVRNYLLYLIN